MHKLIALFLIFSSCAYGSLTGGVGSFTSNISVTNAPALGTPGSATAIVTGNPDTVGLTIKGTDGTSGASAPGSTFFATYTTSVNATSSTGTGTGTAAGGAAISGGVLNLAGGAAVKNVQYTATGNINETQVFTIRLKIKPGYTGNPATRQYFWCRTSGGNANGLIQLFHETDGTLNLSLLDSAGSTLGNLNLDPWSPVSGTTYEFETNIDLVAGAQRLFIDAVQQGSTGTDTGTSALVAGVFRIGKTHDLSGDVATAFTNFSVSDLVVFPTIKHTANFVSELPHVYIPIQTSDLQQWQNTSGGVMSKVDYQGRGVFPTMQLTVQSSGASPSCDADGELTITASHILCICNALAWKKASDGTTACSF